MSATLRGFRNAFRRPGRTLAVVGLVALAVGLALSMAVAQDAVDRQVDDVQATTGTGLEIMPAREGDFFIGPGDSGPLLNESDLAGLGSMEHVASYSLDLQATLQANQTSLQSAFQPPPGVQRPPGGRTFTPPLLAFGTTSPDRVPLDGGGALVVRNGPGAQAEDIGQDPEGFHLTEGRAFDGASSAHEAMVGERLAETNGLDVGETFTIDNQTFTVVGTFDAGNDFANAALMLPLDTLQAVTGQDGKVSRSSVRVDRLENVETVQADLQARLGSGAEVLTQDEAASAAIEPLRAIGSLAWTSLVGAALGAGAITVLTMALVVRERRREVGVLKAIGAAPRHVLRQFAAESATLAVLGVAGGVAFAAAAHDAVLSVLARQSGAAATSLQGTLTPALLLVALGAALLLALAGALVPAVLVTRIRPADVLRGA